MYLKIETKGKKRKDMRIEVGSSGPIDRILLYRVALIESNLKVYTTPLVLQFRAKILKIAFVRSLREQFKSSEPFWLSVPLYICWKVLFLIFQSSCSDYYAAAGCWRHSTTALQDKQHHVIQIVRCCIHALWTPFSSISLMNDQVQRINAPFQSIPYLSNLLETPLLSPHASDTPAALGERDSSPHSAIWSA